MTTPCTVLIASRNRPIYLWACLDALHRHTRAPHRFLLADMGSDDPLVFRVLEGFERRGMFERVIHFPRNDPRLLAGFVRAAMPAWGPTFAYVEADAVVEAGEPCWLARLQALMRANPRLAMLGSATVMEDFVEPDAVERLRGDRDEASWRALIKADSPERTQNAAAAPGPLFRPHNPPGRLLMLRTEAVARVGLSKDSDLDAALRAAGWETAMATEVRHRHLSLTQVFDYPDYDMAARDRYMDGLPLRPAEPASEPASAASGKR